MFDTDLLRILQNQYEDISKSNLNRILFNLEVQMIIDVQRLRKNVNKIALRKDAPISDILQTSSSLSNSYGLEVNLFLTCINTGMLTAAPIIKASPAGRVVISLKDSLLRASDEDLI